MGWDDTRDEGRLKGWLYGCKDSLEEGWLDCYELG